VKLIVWTIRTRPLANTCLPSQSITRARPLTRTNSQHATSRDALCTHPSRSLSWQAVVAKALLPACSLRKSTRLRRRSATMTKTLKRRIHPPRKLTRSSKLTLSNSTGMRVNQAMPPAVSASVNMVRLNTTSTRSDDVDLQRARVRNQRRSGHACSDPGVQSSKANVPERASLHSLSGIKSTEKKIRRR